MSVGSWRQRDATGPGVGLLTPHATYRALFAVRPPSPGTRTGIGHRLPPPPHREPCGARMGTTQTGPGNQRLPVLSGAPFWRPSWPFLSASASGPSGPPLRPPATVGGSPGRHAPRQRSCALTLPTSREWPGHIRHTGHTRPKNEPGRATIFTIAMILIGAPGLS